MSPTTGAERGVVDKYDLVACRENNPSKRAVTTEVRRAHVHCIPSLFDRQHDTGNHRDSLIWWDRSLAYAGTCVHPGHNNNNEQPSNTYVVIVVMVYEYARYARGRV